MPQRSVQLVLQYDGSGFAGWQRQATGRTVQGELEAALARLCSAHIPVIGAGRTDAGVHALGQAAGVRVPEAWTAPRLRAALNAILPPDVWVASAAEMRSGFHARYSATARRYRYVVGTDDAARSPFRKRWEWGLGAELDEEVLARVVQAIRGEHTFRAFAVRGTAPPTDMHRCMIIGAEWRRRAEEQGWVFEIEANRFLHHMVRFLVGTMVDMARGRRDPDDMARLLGSDDNRATSPPAPPHGLFLDAVRYPDDLYVPAS
ncbi:MAG TPA: tRNA pseudouridine(38-40) synthase TruA [Gemmatimonadaceae bacterium]|nr:tRNA pseudouridine(38-40) synthase TruA [Gemmatimonadaceae bacterium]